VLLGLEDLEEPADVRVVQLPHDLRLAVEGLDVLRAALLDLLDGHQPPLEVAVLRDDHLAVATLAQLATHRVALLDIDVVARGAELPVVDVGVVAPAGGPECVQAVPERRARGRRGEEVIVG